MMILIISITPLVQGDMIVVDDDSHYLNYTTCTGVHDCSWMMILIISITPLVQADMIVVDDASHYLNYTTCTRGHDCSG